MHVIASLREAIPSLTRRLLWAGEHPLRNDKIINTNRLTGGLSFLLQLSLSMRQLPPSSDTAIDEA